MIKKYKFRSWILSWITIFENIISIITFTLYHPGWSWNFLRWDVKNRINENKKDK